MVLAGSKLSGGIASRAAQRPSPTLQRVCRFLVAIQARNPHSESESHGKQERAAAPNGASFVGAPQDFHDFEAFFQRFEREIFGYLWRMTGDEQTAYDLSQETFLRAWQRFAQIRAYERPGGWLFRVATNLAINSQRQRATTTARVTPFDEDAGPTGSDPALRVVESDSLRRALLALPPRQRAALVLREVYGLSCDEVAAALDISRGAAKVLLWRAREQLRASYLREEGRP